MNIKVTSRHFKAHETLIGYAEECVGSLERFYDGIIKADVVLVFEKVQKSTKVAEISLKVHNAILTGVGESEEFQKSVDIALQKVRVQLKKYKERLPSHNRRISRKVRGRSAE